MGRTVLLLLLLLFATPLQAVMAAPTLQGENLLRNPGFEEGFYYWNGINELHVGVGWTPWWIENPDHSPTYFRPEYKQAQAQEFANRVHNGANAQQWFKLYSSFYAGIYQHVEGVNPDESYRFSIWAQVWSSTEDNPPNQSTAPANPHLQIGIDPNGNVDPFSADIIWSPEASLGQVIDGWTQLSVNAVARHSTITVFVRSRPEFANKHNNVYLDDAMLQAVVPQTPTVPPPTETPVPTETPQPPAATATSVVTEVPPATETPVVLEPVATSTATTAPPATTVPTQAPTSTQVQPTAVPATATWTALPPETATATNTATATSSPSPTVTETATEEQPTATEQAATEIAEVLPTSPPATESVPDSEAEQPEGPGRGILCATPILGVGVFGLFLIILRRKNFWSRPPG